MTNLERIYELQQKKAALDKQVKDVNAELQNLRKGLELGLQSDGDYVVDVRPSMRFDAATAKKNLDDALFQAILVSKPDSAQAKRMLTGYEYELCQRQVGVLATVKKVQDIDG